MASQSACREHRNDCLRQLRNVGLVLAIAWIATGCANPSSYWKARRLDLLDTASVGVGYGIGLSGHLQASELVHGAVGLSWGRLYGSRRRHVGAWEEMDMGWPATFVMSALLPDAWQKNGALCIFSALVLPTDGEDVTYLGEGVRIPDHARGWSADQELHGCLINPLFTGYVALPLAYDFDPEWYGPNGEFSFSFMALVVGGRVSFDPIQLGDFLVGFFGFDPAGDDPEPEQPETTAAAGAGEPIALNRRQRDVL